MSAEESDRNAVGGSTGEVVNERDMLNVKHCSEPKIGEHYYKMSSNPRGFCLIFNIFKFPETTYDLRKGSEIEAKRLSDIFKQLYFIPKVVDNPTKKDIEDTVGEYAQNEDLKRHDSIVVIVLSHGLSGGFIASDGGYIQFKDLVDKLNNKNCSYLINKPKLFFFSCCRGNLNIKDMPDLGVEHTIQALDDLKINAIADTIPYSMPEPDTITFTTIKVPMASDIMICYSTVDGYVSWRCEETGTWLGWALSQTLLKHSHEKDLLQMLTEISNSVDERKMNGDIQAKQVIEIILRGFKKTFHFNPGYPPPVAGDAID